MDEQDRSRLRLTNLIKQRTQELARKLEAVGDGRGGAFELPDDTMETMLALDDLKHEFDLRFGGAPGDDAEGVPVPVKPSPRPRSGETRLPCPDRAADDRPDENNYE